MGQAELHGANPAFSFERLVPGDIARLAEGRIRYTQLTNDAGGIIDDLWSPGAPIICFWWPMPGGKMPITAIFDPAWAMMQP